MENSEIIYGKNSVMEALIAGNREINKILISKNIHSDNKINKIKELAQEKGIVFQFVAREKFQPYAEFNHQGIIAQISPIKYYDLDEFLENREIDVNNASEFSEILKMEEEIKKHLDMAKKRVSILSLKMVLDNLANFFIRDELGTYKDGYVSAIAISKKLQIMFPQNHYQTHCKI